MSAVLALLASLVWGTSDFVGGVTARRLPIRALVLTSQAIGLSILLVVVTATGLWTSDGHALLWGLVGGSFGVFALGAFYRGLAIGPMSIVSPVASIGVLVPFADGLARGEHPAALQLVGAVLAVGGVAMAARPRESGGGSGRHGVAVGLGLVSAVGFGVVLLAVQQGSAGGTDGAEGIAMTLVWMRVLSVTALGLSALATARTSYRVQRWPGRADVVPVLVVGSFDLGANALFAIAGRGHLLAVVAVLSSLYPAVTAVLAWAIARERLGRGQAVGVAGALAGVVLLAAG